MSNPESDEDFNSNSNLKKMPKWAVVDTGQPNVRPARELVTEHPRASLDEDGEMDWSRSALLSLDLVDAGRSGVLLVHVEGRGVVVIKATTNPAQELFASLAAPEMGVSVPRCRLVSPGEPEHTAIREHVSALLTPNTYEHGIISWTYLKQNLLLVMELAAGYTVLPQVASGAIGRSALRRIGQVLALDVLLHNGDRIPIGDLWNNNGNLANVMVSNSGDGAIMAVDNVGSSPTNEQLREGFLHRLHSLLESRKSLLRGLETTLGCLGSKVAALEGGEAEQLEVLADGMVQGLERIHTHLTPQRLGELRARVEDMGSNGAVWESSLDSVAVNFMTEVFAIVEEVLATGDLRTSSLSSSPDNVMFQRIEGADGCGAMLQALPVDEQLVVFFDFDRTLTNGFALPTETALEKRVRGGEATVRGLARLHLAQVPLFIVTARPPRELVVLQLAASLRGPQKEIGRFFLPTDAEVSAEEVSFGDVPLARATNARLYASDYQKSMAIAHALDDLFPADEESRISKVTVVFVDDVYMNAHDVGTGTAVALRDAGRTDLADAVSVRSVWWDTFLEETGDAPSMGLVASDNIEKGYPAYSRSVLADFGLTPAEVDRRIEVYAAAERNAGITVAREAPKPPGKLKAATAAQMKLASFLFGGGKKR
ncbi:Actin-fragmin kinase [Hondaea fermentalgiana]|uniref:Actin-fragmin kinase n=1 Tax=Hondaea fermentalgiana TaxID=2315210 RepID=A0A2R5G8I5_9STRA|nr:Actin-fragmin kinase [Hondaea fermentalgiana]|eukprot:GBG23994.1 Actin-fragmin kinase [Hondaea fermentalgiana]